jgi:hypothetical protein
MFRPQYPDRLSRLGFKLGKGGAHAARSMMLADLERVMTAAGSEAGKEDYRREIVDTNVLSKRTVRNRRLSYKHLRELYALDPSVCLFRAFRTLWMHDAAGRPVLALQLALGRDALLRVSAPYILGTVLGDNVTSEETGALLAREDKSRFSVASLKSFVRNIHGTWTQAGFLKGKVHKLRASPSIGPTNVAYALFMSHLDGFEAPRLFSSDWVRVLDQTRERLIELTQSAAQRGLLVFRRTGDVMEIRFPGYLTAEEETWLNEQA